MKIHTYHIFRIWKRYVFYIWQWNILLFEKETFFVFESDTFLYLKLTHFRIWKWHLLSWKCWISVFERYTFLYLQLAHFSYLKLPHFSYLKTAHFVFAIDTFFIFESSTFRISKLHISFLIIRRLLDKVTWEMTTFEMLTLFRMDIFGAAHGWGWEPKKGLPLPKICHTYPTMMKLDTVVPYLKKIQKMYESRDKPAYFCWHQHFSTKVSKFCYIKKYRYGLHFTA